MLKPNRFYHVYNHANDREDLFKNVIDYHNFLERLVYYLFPICEIHAYCLMPNHFHLLIRVKDEKKLIEHFGKKAGKDYRKLCRLLSQTYSNFFNSYTKRYNSKYQRRGSLFMRPFKAKKIGDLAYLITTFLYIHRNPVHHEFCSRCEDWPYSSYHAYLIGDSNFLFTDLFLEWFKSPAYFIHIHHLETY